MKKFKRNKCPWEFRGETTCGDLFWCSKCGALSWNEYRTKQEVENCGYDFETHLCYDQGSVP